MASDIKCLFPGASACSSCHSFCQRFNKHTHVCAAEAGIHGISRSAFNKLVCFNFHTGMRKLSRNGNRWMSTVLNTMLSHNVENCVDLLREFEQYKVGPAGRDEGLGLGACNGRPSQCNSRDNIISLVTTIINDDLVEHTDPNKVRIRSCCTLQVGRSDRYTPCLFLLDLFS